MKGLLKEHFESIEENMLYKSRKTQLFSQEWRKEDVFHGCLWPVMTSEKIALWEWSQLQAYSLLAISSTVYKNRTPCLVPNAALKVRQSCLLKLFHEHVGKRIY